MFRHVTESKWNLKPFFKPKLKPNFSQLNCHPAGLPEDLFSYRESVFREDLFLYNCLQDLLPETKKTRKDITVPHLGWKGRKSYNTSFVVYIATEEEVRFRTVKYEDGYIFSRSK